MSSQLPVIELSGSPRERGQAHGEAFRDVIHKVYTEYFEDVLHPPEEKPHSLTREWCMAWAREHIPHVRDYAPDLFEEVEGIAEGTKMAVEDVIFLNGFLAIADWASPTFQEHRLAQSGGCTSFGVSGHLTGGEAIIGQNYDLESLYQRGAVLLRVKSDDAPDSLLYTTAGMVGCAGINAAGIAVVINNLIPNDSRAGVLYPFQVRKLLQASDPGSAMDAVIFAQRTSGTNYIVAHESGAVVALETSARDYAVIDGWAGPIGHANHYVGDKMLKYEARWTGERGQSIFRHSRMNYLLREDEEQINLKRFKQILSDHANYPIAICRHDDPYGTCGKTICGMIFNPAQRKAYISAGNPCENAFVEYEV
jgi:isopenicillin-N N-acyltransferase-like protein